MDGWSHFLSIGTTVPSDLTRTRSRIVEQQKQKTSASDISIGFFRETNAWNKPLLTSNFASKSMGPKSQLTQNHAPSTSEQQTPFSTETNTLARRNLAEAFELHVESAGIDVSATPNTKSLPKGDPPSLISPTGVAELNPEMQGIDTSTTVPVNLMTNADVPHFHLHPDLKRDLSQALVNRVSFYAVIHDINKEASSMASNDFATLRMVKSVDEEDEMLSPLVMAINGRPSNGRQSLSLANSAMIDEETWLLRAIDSRGDEDRSQVASCPPTFLQAMGEREYEKPVSSLETSRTQLWKPSRSWWEAKSGKNPWIEPMSHNKRWRYLWPLIHYHKFLAKCIKKLKRNGVDVKVSVSPVAVFLREEVCSVSDHLAAVSLFSSEEWMSCLGNFEGWIDTSSQSEKSLKQQVSNLALRPLNEPGDVDSPLLRNQIDDQFLRTMASAREEISSGAQAGTSKKQAANKKKPKQKTSETQVQSGSQPRHGLPLHPQSRQNTRTASYTPRGKGGSRSMQPPGKPSASGDGSTDSRPSYVYPAGRWQDSRNGQPPFVCDDLTSVHSTLSGDSGHYHPIPGSMEYGMYPHAAPPMGYYPPGHGGTPDQSFSSNGTASYQMPPGFQFYYPDPYAAQQWYGQAPVDPNSSYGEDANPGTPRSCTSPGNYAAKEHTMQTPSQRNGLPPMSPFWADHLHSTLGMAGVYTPAKPHPGTPQRTQYREGEEKKEQNERQPDAQPLILNPFYPYGNYATGEVPPSPATQFMMPPQNNYHFYGNPYGYETHFSPRRNGRKKPPQDNETPPKPHVKPEISTPEKLEPPSVVRKNVDDATVNTDATAAETHSVAVVAES
mmetsp:Transcript_19025/g.27341  ORF Transcript_19025/g.27341 Transcript_19025/m.27341 type:complete len:838 (-) Transcript_19025:214-2727(-)|eukprot:CAMPEP_0202448214 /NCGR_PEP_ID=MMETSP1360-20130828/7021_1 /ASSEMBLY_ACC=CAM_ASM_000848 /TAXON_ID=515479 /ORGANISM="Licmophora paradoxa, Strain CCMP2313" /LENGTH=837 /DNA_ID=CAMNT_0049065681 /DNA_START=82 /DNA_END=2595 /DNA_ORIENTATION=+